VTHFVSFFAFVAGNIVNFHPFTVARVQLAQTKQDVWDIKTNKVLLFTVYELDVEAERGKYQRVRLAVSPSIRESFN